MIRREDITSTDAKEWLRAAWTPVRITGLGVLKAGSPDPVYRITLTAGVAKAHERAEAFRTHVSGRDPNVLADVRHIARALAADVEVWAIPRHGGRFDTKLGRHVSYPPVLVATVAP